jgi:hypothetical protein
MGKFLYSSEDLGKKLQALRAKVVRLSLLRLIAFLGLGAFFILSLTDGGFWIFLLLGFLVLFVSLIKQFNHHKDQERIYLAIEQLEKRKQWRQDRHLADLDAGLEFADKAHPFSGDLDLFGPHSLFQLLNHSHSPAGKKALAALMGSSFDSNLAQQRREAVAELQEKPAFLRAMEAIGLAFAQEKQTSWKLWLERSGQAFSIKCLRF